jgi:fumarate reductase subunit D
MNKDLFSALIQAALSLLILIGFFVTLWLFIYRAPTMSADVKQIVSDLVSALTVMLAGAMGFWFARHRTESTPTKPEAPAQGKPK